MLNQSVYDQLRQKFVAHYGCEPEVVAYAPGRIEVLGNHTDYNEGLVLSAAINLGTFFAVARGSSSECRLVAGDLMREVVFDLAKIEPSGSDTWQNYVKGTLAGLLEHGAATCGFKAMFLGNIPLGGGLSSSAALEMSAGLALSELYQIEVSEGTLAKIGQWAEHHFAGCKCGLLDQTTSLAGRWGKLVMTDFRTLEYTHVAMGEEVCFLMCNTHARHALVDGAYNRLRESCERAAAHFAQKLRHPVAALRDVTMPEWAVYRFGLTVEDANRAAHPIGESERVVKAMELLERGEVAAFGALMFDSHESSRVLFGNSCSELDTVVEAARKVPGVLGARLSGGGFGGSVVVLLHPRDAETAAAALSNAYAARFGNACEVNVVVPADGARVLSATERGCRGERNG